MCVNSLNFKNCSSYDRNPGTYYSERAKVIHPETDETGVDGNMSDAILLLRLEHGNMARLLDWIDDQIKTLDTGAAADYHLLSQAMYYLQNYPDQCHHPKEDLVLEVIARRNPGAAADIGDLSVEHKKLAQLTDRAAAAVSNNVNANRNDKLAGTLRDLVAEYRRHMTKEEEIFFPCALEVLERSDWSSIDFELFDRDDPLFDHSQEQRFRELREGVSRYTRRYLEMTAAQQEIELLENLNNIDEFNHAMENLGSRLRLVSFTEGRYGLEREGKLLAYIPSNEEIQAMWCAYYYAKGAEEITLA